MALHCAPNIISTYILKTKTIQPNYLNLNHIQTPNLKRKRNTHRSFGILMVVGGQCNRGDDPLDSSFSLFQMFC